MVWPLKNWSSSPEYPSKPDIWKGKKAYIPILFLLPSSYSTSGELTHLSDPQFVCLLNKNLALGTFILALKFYASHILQQWREGNEALTFEFLQGLFIAQRAVVLSNSYFPDHGQQTDSACGYTGILDTFPILLL